MTLIPTGRTPADTKRLIPLLKQGIKLVSQVTQDLDGAVAAAEDDDTAGEMRRLRDYLCEALLAADTALRRLNRMEGLRPEIRKASAARAGLGEAWRSDGARP